LLHAQGMIHFSQHLLHTLSQFHYWFEHWSVTLSDTFRSNAKTHRHRIGTLSATVASHPSSPDRWTNIVEYQNSTKSFWTLLLCSIVWLQLSRLWNLELSVDQSMICFWLYFLWKRKCLRGQISLLNICGAS
jgi:hypothetical protein